MNAPVTTERKSLLPLRLRSTTVVGSKSIPTASCPTTPVTTSMPLAVQNDTKSSLTVGNRVLVNGLKSGILRYLGSVEFAQGLFCGVELDEPDGKHDGQVNDIRYFQCKINHGIFVPHDKVVLASRERANTSQRSMSRLKPPMTRSMTISSTINNKIEQIPIKTSQLPDIIPSPSTPTQPVSIITPTENTKPMIQSLPITIDEPLETIDADFTDSVSLILHQLQQEPKALVIQSRPSIAISEEGTIDDDDDDDDEFDNESIAESILSEKIPSIDNLSSINDSIKTLQTNLSFDLNQNLIMKKTNLLNSKSLSYSNKSLSNSTTSLNKLKINPIENKGNSSKKKPNLPTPIPTPVIQKTVSERKLSIPLTVSRKPTIPLTISRRSSLIPSKPELSSSRKSVISLGSQSKLNQSPSSSNSINSSHSDLTTNQKLTSKSIRTISHSINLNSNKKSDDTPPPPDHQLMIQKIVIQSLESTNEHLKKQYQHLLNQFDLMCILNQYSINKNEQIKEEYQLKLSKVRITNNQLKTSIEQLELLQKNELIKLNEQNQNYIQSIKEIHKQESMKSQQEIDKLFNEKTEIEIRCTTLQEQVDRFMEEMSNSEYADPLLRHVETLEKDRTSLQTVLELRNQELTQIRTRINEQVFEREDQLALQKRIDMAENRNQDLVCLLRNWQLNEKAVTVERDRLKEQLAQLERDNHQLTFENETLLYSLRQRSSTISNIPTSRLNINSKFTSNRAHSFPSIITTTSRNERFTRSLSLNCIFNR